MRTKDSSAFCSGQDVLVRRRASRTQAATENAHTATPTATFLHPRGMQPLSALRVAARVPKSRLPAPFERIRKAHTRHRYTFWLVQQSSSSFPSTLDRPSAHSGQERLGRDAPNHFGHLAHRLQVLLATRAPRYQLLPNPALIYPPRRSGMGPVAQLVFKTSAVV